MRTPAGSERKKEAYCGLSNEELCALVKQGDREAAFLLFEQNKRFCWKIARRYANLCAWFDQEDAMQSAFEGLLIAALKYDDQRAGCFTTILPYYVKSACCAALCLRSKHDQNNFFADVKAISLQTPIDEDGAELEEIVPDDKQEPVEDVVIKAAVNSEIRAAVEDLPDAERDVIKDVYFKGQSCGQDRMSIRNKAFQHLYRDKRIKDMEVSQSHRLLTERANRNEVATLSIQWGTERALEILEGRYEQKI